MTNKVSTEFDFGFSFSDSTEEESNLQSQVQQTTEVLNQTQQTAQELQTKLNNLLGSINSFLDNLAKEPEKRYLLWPDRATKVAAYKKYIQTLIK